jgi:hypothetical protein
MISLDLESILVLALATWRLSHMVTSESCPFGICEKLRLRLPMGGLMTCIYCFSVWAGTLMLILWYSDLYPLVYILAISGLALAIRSYTGIGITD